MQKSAQFYILGNTLPAARYHFVCRLAEKAFTRGHRIYLHCRDETECHLMDNLLWEYSPTSFLPHALASAEHKAHYPVLLGYAENEAHYGKGMDLLINLSPHLPDMVSQYERVVEVSHQDDELLKVTRSHYAALNDRGFEMKTYKL